MDVVADIARGLDAGGIALEPGLHQIGGTARLLPGAEGVGDHELLEGEALALGVERRGRRGQGRGRKG
jgi:hypothetical protein